MQKLYSNFNKTKMSTIQKQKQKQKQKREIEREIEIDRVMNKTSQGKVLAT